MFKKVLNIISHLKRHNMNLFPITLLIFLIFYFHKAKSNLPLVINTWAFTESNKVAWEILNEPNGSPLDALVAGCSKCEELQCDGTVGFGGSPDENSETTLDAMIMDGETMNVGAVANLRNVKDAIKVARHILENTRHTMLAGDQATDFAVEMGFQKESLVTPKSKKIWSDWKEKNCQPNFWQNVVPNPTQQCGPYFPIQNFKETNDLNDVRFNFGSGNHDTIGMIVIDKNGKSFVGTSTNGARHKIPGRVGDSPIPGAGAYADNNIGAAAATGDGDIMMRFLPAFVAIENLRHGMSVKESATNAMQRIRKYHPKFFGGLVVSNKDGEYSAACVGMEKFPFSVYKNGQDSVKVEYVNCLET